MTNENKIYRVKAHFRKPQLKKNINFVMDVRASKIEDVLEKVYSEIGSRHNVKREEIFIPKDGGITEIDISEARTPMFAQIDEQDFKLIQD